MTLALGPPSTYSALRQVTSSSSENAIDGAAPAPQSTSLHAANAAARMGRTVSGRMNALASRWRLKPTQSPGHARGAPVVLQPFASRGQSPLHVVLRQKASASSGAK